MSFDLPTVALIGGLVGVLVVVIRFVAEVLVPWMTNRKTKQIFNRLSRDFIPVTVLLDREGKGEVIMGSDGELLAAWRKDLRDFHWAATKDVLGHEPASHQRGSARRLVAKLPPELAEFADEMADFEDEARQDGHWSEPAETAALVVLVLKSRVRRIRPGKRRQAG